jgi:hypothetical protein
MDAFAINKILQNQIKPGLEFKAPVIREIRPVSLNSDLIPDILPSKTNQSQSSFPWEELVILSGVAILIIIIINEIQKRQNYNIFSISRQDQQSNSNRNSKKIMPQ